MLAFMQKYEPQAYALLRIFASFLFIFHGTQKLFSWPVDAFPNSPAWMTYGVGSFELIGGSLMLLGFYTGPLAFLASGMMAVGYFMIHFKMDAIWPIMNRGERATLWAFIYLYISTRGSGIWSLDAMFRKG